MGLTIEVKLVYGPRCHIKVPGTIAETQEGKDGRQERGCDEVESSELIEVGRFDSRGLQTGRQYVSR
jgi:hypothetical protein